MKRLGLWIAFIVLISCASAPEGVSVKPETPPTVENAYLVRLAEMYAADTRSVSFNDLQPEGQLLGRTHFYLPTLSYEAFQIALRFDLHQTLTPQEFAFFAYSLFENLTIVDKNLAEIRDVIVPRYFANGAPLVIHVTFLGMGDKLMLVWIANTFDQGEDWDPDLAKLRGPLVPVPRFEDIGKRNNGAGALSGIIHIYDGFLTTIQDDQILLDPDKTEDREVAFDLADDYIRDRQRGNEGWIPARLERIGRDESQDPVVRALAYLNLIQHYFYLEDGDSFNLSFEEYKASGLMSDPSLVGNVISEVGEKFVPYILSAYLNIGSHRQEGRETGNDQ